jgi:hypothetical protein
MKKMGYCMEVAIFSGISALKRFSLETSSGKWADTCSPWFGAKEGEFKLGDSSQLEKGLCHRVK